ncbi:DUF4062 domain-containing protein [Sphingomonas sp.]|jgi:hypothetical protein|uniref:DUF4062 domain-containing protein n=1 Tax=Sphingomonas sp. TaxID=28214 RepID=UPI0017D9DAE0|nr:DUF4062 domain-containing protein [Sphingomonas sp.]MBA3512302.1 DUF4062 domain-containing protein [Sphingomonas sp.]
MKIFISSLVRGFEDFRAAAVAAVRSLGHEPVTAETFPAGVSSPRVACLEGVRHADMVVLILGARYGRVQPVSGLSATHEEYREAKDHRPVIAFVQEGVEQERAQEEFVREVKDWSGGLFGGDFRTAEELRDAITRAIHRFELSAAAAPVDAGEMLARALELIPTENHNIIRRGGPLLHLAVVGGPAQTILRPVEIERPDFARGLLREATYGDSALFDPAHGSESNLAGGTLKLSQETGATIVVDERGSVRVSVPIASGTGMVGALIEENVADALGRALTQSAQILAKIDETERLSRIVVAAGISSNGAMGWRTRAEDAASPNSMTMSMFHQGDREPVHFQPPDRARAALSFDRERMAEDLVALLRRQWS